MLKSTLLAPWNGTSEFVLNEDPATAPGFLFLQGDCMFSVNRRVSANQARYVVRDGRMSRMSMKPSWWDVIHNDFKALKRKYSGFDSYKYALELTR